MKCSRCQQENPPGSNFCLGCGTRLSAACSTCGNDLPAGSRFCNRCGTPVRAEGISQARFAAPETYTPKYLAEKILTSRTALEGERKQVTVLFADLKGSMELLADRDPEEARKILDPVLEHMMEAVHRYEGTVNQVMGDGIMALFGAPLAHEDHAVRACYAALRMQDAVRRYSEELRRRQGVEVLIRVGLNSGDVVVRSIGSDLRMDYTAVGQTTHLAARMEQIADPGAIAVTPATLALAEGYVQVKPLGPVPVKGLPEAIEVYEVTAASPVRTRMQAVARRALTRFVGRDAELERLRLAQQDAGAGRGQAVAITGEAGVGKSRLVYEFTHSHRLQGWVVLESGSVSYGKATPYLPLIDLLRAYFRIETSDDVRTVRAKVTGTILTLDEALKDTIPSALWLLDALPEDSPFLELDPAERRRRTLTTMMALLLRESRAHPLVVVFEDLHWIDSETQTFLDTLVEGLPATSILLVVNYRPEYRHGWGSRTYYHQLRIDPLASESADDLLDGLLGEEASAGALKSRLIERTEGNPLFLEECVRALVETGALAGRPGAYRLVKSVDTVALPATVQAIIAARIDRLSIADKRLLQAAAVVGKDIPLALLAAVADLDDEALPRGLARLQPAEFLYETRLFPDVEYTFKHALTHDVAYGSLLQARRRTLHACIVGAIENLYPGHILEHVERLAHHASRGEMWAKAVQYCGQAGGKAAARSAHTEAVAYFEQALSVLQYLPDSRGRSERAIDLRFGLRNSLFVLGENQRLLEHLRAAENLAEALDDQRRLGRVACYMTRHFGAVGDSDRALAAGHRALRISEVLGDFPLQVETNFQLGREYYVLGDYRQAIALIGKNVETLRGTLQHQRFGFPFVAAVLSRTFVVRCLAELGRFAEGMTRAEEAVRIAEASNDFLGLSDGYLSIGYLCLRKGEFQRAQPVLERSLALVQASNFRLVFPQHAAALGAVYAFSRQVERALPLLARAMTQSESSKSRATQSHYVAALSEGYLLAGRADEARPLAERALELSDHKRRGDGAWLRRLLGAIAARLDPPEAQHAERWYGEALVLAEELGMRPLIAHCHLGLGKLYRRTSKRQQAQEHFTAATTMYREMGMTYWLEQTEAEMRELA